MPADSCHSKIQQHSNFESFPRQCMPLEAGEDHQFTASIRRKRIWPHLVSPIGTGQRKGETTSALFGYKHINEDHVHTDGKVFKRK